jgi:PAS domain S-box-containing protein
MRVIVGRPELGEIKDEELPQGIGPDALNVMSERLARAYADAEQRFDMEIDFDDGSGVPHTYKMTTVISYDRNGHPERVYGIAQDMALINEARRNLEENIRLNTVLDSMDDGVFVTDMSGFVIKANQRAKDFFRHDRRDANRVNIVDLGPLIGEDLADLARLILSNGSTGHIRILARAPRGALVPIELRWTPQKLDSMDVMVFVARDITDIQREEEESMRAAEVVRMGGTRGKIGFWDLDLDSDRIYWNDNMYCIFDVKGGEFSHRNKDFLQFVIPEDKERVAKEMHLALEGLHAFETEFRVSWRDGSVHRIRAIATVQMDANGVPVRVVGNNWEIPL